MSLPNTTFPPSALWDYSVSLYALPGVEAACLDLQRRGLDVNCVLFAAWLGASGRGSPEAGEWADVQARVATWRREVVEALRAVRRRLKPLAAHGDGAIRALRSAVQACELDAEHIEQLMLEAALARQPQPLAPGERLADAGRNLRRYCAAALGRRPDAPLVRDLRVILRAAFPEAAADGLATALSGGED